MLKGDGSVERRLYGAKKGRIRKCGARFGFPQKCTVHE